MNSLKAQSPELVAHYLAHEAEYSKIADAGSIPRFSPELMSYMTAKLGSLENARLVEAVSRVGNYGDETEHALVRKAVSKLQKKDGAILLPGKRAKAGQLNLVEDLTPLLLHFGIRLASNEQSELVLILRDIASQMIVSGDQRDTLRKKIKDDLAYQKEIKKAIREAVRRGLRSLLI